MLTHFRNSPKLSIEPSTFVRPVIYLLAGTSSSGKSTTAFHLKRALESTSESKVEILSYDDFCELHNEPFMRFLDECVVAAGFKEGLMHAIGNKASLSSEEIEQLENCVEEKGTPWMQQKLADAAIVAMKAGKSVIIDTLNTHDIVSRLKASDACPDPNVVNILLNVPFTSFPERVQSRNQQALKDYRRDFKSKAYKNCREAFDMIEQYAQFYDFAPTDDKQGIDKSAIIQTLESAYDDSIQLYLDMANAHQAYLDALEQDDKVDVEKCNQLKKKIDALVTESEDLKANRTKTIKKLSNTLMDNTHSSRFNCSSLNLM